MTFTKCQAAFGAVFLGLALASAAQSVCPPSCPITGGGAATQDCHAEFASTRMRLNYPPFNPAKPTKKSSSVRCFDGEPGCDLDGVVNGECRFDIDVCLLHDADPALPACAPADVTSVRVSAARSNPDLQSLQIALAALVPATSNVCTSGQSLRVALKTTSAGLKRATKKLRLRAKTALGSDRDNLKLTCVPHAWPSYGYDYANHRATPLENELTTTNVVSLTEKWTFDLSNSTSAGVTSTPTVDDKKVYVTSWNGSLYALDAKSGSLRWTYDTGSSSQLGVQSSATLTADGRLLVGDSTGKLYCFLAQSGALLWTASVADTDPSGSHIWASPVVANGRVFIGQASHNDNPCVRGHLYAFDLDTGVELWRFATVPAKVCNNDTTVACNSDTDCSGGTCVDGLGGGITASVAVNSTGDTVYAASVGCYTYPSIGNSDALFSFDAATGVPNWIYRTQSIQQFSAGPPYHDYGFLNGPLLIDASDSSTARSIVVGGSKDGTLYAADAGSGMPVWSNILAPAPSFAGFGLFNGALGFADHSLFAALYDLNNTWPSSNPHLYAFRDGNGSPIWSDQIGVSWGSVAWANGLLFVGTQAAPRLYIYDAQSGMRLKEVVMPASVSSGASIVNGTVYVGYGVFGATGGIKAFGLP